MTKRLQTDCIRYVVVLLLFTANGLFAQDAISTDEGQRFVAVGQLARVSREGKSARYVLLDELGEVTASLRTASGVELREFVGQDVGVTARTLVDGDTPVLLAENVTTFGEARQVSPDDIDRHIALASHEEEYIAQSGGLPSIITAPSIAEEYPATEFGPIIGEEIVASDYVGTSCGIDGCASCGGGCGSVACSTCAACPCGLPGRFWVRSEYLIWWTKGMDTPALVTTSPAGTPRASAGVLGQPGTQTLFGGEELFDDSRSGARFRIGKWCDQCNWIGFETEYFFLSDEDDNFDCTDVGQTIYARPLFEVNSGEQNSELVQFPGVLNGSIHIDADSSLWSISPRLRVNLSCERFPGCNPCDPCDYGGYRLDLLVGYRYMQLDDSVRIHESLATVSTATPTYFVLRDEFDSTNEFNGADLGFLWEGYRGPWSLELVGRVGIGQTSQEVSIRGSTATTSGTSTFNDPGGLLALESNIGTYSRDEFTILPEMQATLGYAISPRSRLLVGYSFMYWNDVARAGEHIDTNVNTDLIPPAQATTAPASPVFAWKDSSYWAQGLSLGLEYRW